MNKEPIATKESWTLFKVPDNSGATWTNLHLCRKGRRLPKKSWRFAWNGERLSRTRDLGLLAQHHEDVLEWVYEVLDEGAA